MIKKKKKKINPCKRTREMFFPPTFTTDIIFKYNTVFVRRITYGILCSISVRAFLINMQIYPNNTSANINWAAPTEFTINEFAITDKLKRGDAYRRQNVNYKKKNSRTVG